MLWITYPTAAIPAPNKSGLWLIQAPTRRPPFDPPFITNFSLQVYLFRIKNSAAPCNVNKYHNASKSDIEN